MTGKLVTFTWGFFPFLLTVLINWGSLSPVEQLSDLFCLKTDCLQMVPHSRGVFPVPLKFIKKILFLCFHVLLFTLNIYAEFTGDMI